MERSAGSSRVRLLAPASLVAIFIAGLALCAGTAGNAAQLGHWPSVQEQLVNGHVIPGSALERLILENQDFNMLRAEEANDSRRIPLFLRVVYRKHHPHDRYLAHDPTGGYPLVLNEVWEWMLTHQDLKPGPGILGVSAGNRSASETGEERISGAQSSPRSESEIRVNRNNTQQIIGASNNISASGMQAQFFSSNGGATWGQTSLSLQPGDSFMSDPTVEWTSDGTAWSTTIGIDSTQTNLIMRSYKSTNGGASWTFDATFSGSFTNNDKQQQWTDHSVTSPFKDNIYVIWHPGLPCVVARRTGPTGSWQTPVQVSGSETTGTAIGADIKTNANGDVFGFYPDTGSQGLYVVKSTNGGASFSAPTRIATSFGSFQFAVPADASRQLLIYTTGAAYRTGSLNNVYVAWDDLSGDAGCTSGGGPGTNASSTCKSRIFFSRSTDGGATWSAPVKINNQSGLNDQFFPWLVVDDSNGKLALAYYDSVGDSTRASTNLYYQSSIDNGLTWSAPFKVTTASTNETTAGADSGNQYGDYIGLDGISNLYFPSWTDRRSGASEEIWTAAIQDTTSTSDFTIAASPTSTSIAQGGSGNVTISTTVSGGFNNAVALSASGQPSGTTVAFNPTSIAAPGAGSSTMTITVGASTATGTYPITVTGTGGSTTHNTTVTLTVTASGFSISASPTSVTVAQGGSGNSTISTTAQGTFNSAIALSASGQPTGVTVAFNPTSIAAPGTGSSTMSMTVASSTVPGTYPITVTGTGGSTTHSTTVTLTVTGTDFTIAASPTSTTITQGTAGNVTISTTISGGFNSAVALSASGQPSGVTVAFNPTSIAAPGSGSSTMTITVASSAATGNSTITVTGTGGGKTHTATVSLTVTAPSTNPIVNGGFETGNFSGWTTSGAASSVIAGAAHSGSFGAQLGTTTPTNGDSSVSQTFTMPASSPSLSFWYNNHCPDSLTYDWATATLTDNVTSVTTTLLAKICSNPGGTWTQVNYNAAANAGHSVTLTLTNHDDNFSGDPTYTWYDDVVVTSGGGCTPPAAPTGVTASSSSQTGSTVSWTASSGATSYTILRSTTSGGPYSQVGTSTSTTFADSGLTCGTTYYYVVTATNGSCASGNSAQASATTSACGGGNPFVNPGFETGTLSGWTASGASTSATNAIAHSGTYSARLGSTSATNGDSTISQTVTMPAGTSRVTFWYYMICPDTLTYDWATATIRDNTTGITTTILQKTCTNNGTWVQVSGAATAGHSVTLTLLSHDDNYSGDPTRTYFDDVNVQ